MRIASPIDPEHGADPKQPQTLLEVPNAEVLRKLLEVWKSIKRSADVVLAFDKSGSMAGRPLEQAKAGAKAFFDNLQDQDQVTLMFFDHNIYPRIGPQTLAKGRSDLLSRIEAISAGGGTALYDAVAQAYRDAQEQARKDPSRIQAVVVITDGRDEHSRLRFPDLQRLLSSEDSSIKVFTIAYGAQADLDVLNRIAEASKGSSAKGTAETIVQVYQDIAAFF